MNYLFLVKLYTCSIPSLSLDPSPIKRDMEEPYMVGYVFMYHLENDHVYIYIYIFL